MCFANSGVEEIELPHSVRCIEDKAFRCCKDLKRIVADGVEVIGEYAFAESGLESFCASSSLRKIKSYAFTDCKALRHVDLRNGQKSLPSEDSGLEEIGCKALYGSGLETFAAPPSL